MKKPLLLAIWMMAGLLARPGQAAPRAGACDTLAGRWSWFTGGIVTVRDDGVVDATIVGGQCERTDAGQRRYVIRWTNGYVDTLTLSSDGNTLDGANAQGIPVFADRVGT